MKAFFALIASIFAIAGCNLGKKTDDPLAAANGSTTTTKAEQKPTKKWTRAELSESLKGKTQQEVIEFIGKPDDTNLGAASGDFATEYYYNRVVIDPASEKYLPIHVLFSKGKAVGCGIR